MSPETLKNVHYAEPTQIQIEAIPAILQGQDVIGAAQTGSGKTAAFLLPLIQKQLEGRVPRHNQVNSLILVPTHELAIQIEEDLREYADEMDLKMTSVFGGVKINPQMMRCRGGMDIMVATPGRLLDLYHQNAIKFEDLNTLILDEADRMLDMGFILDLRKIISLLPKKRQSLLFSATFSEDLLALSKTLVQSPVEIKVNPQETTNKEIQHYIYEVDKKQKPKLLLQLMDENEWDQVLVFIKTKRDANILAGYLTDKGYQAGAIHSNKSQSARTSIVRNFKTGSIKVLVATDLLARGLDIEKLPHVVNFHLPKVAEDYVHRIGRTGRAGESGEAISFVSSSEYDLLRAIETQIQKHIERRVHEDFVPVNPVQPSGEIKPLKPKKPKKNKKLKEPEVPAEPSVNPWSK